MSAPASRNRFVSRAACSTTCAAVYGFVSRATIPRCKSIRTSAVVFGSIENCVDAIRDLLLGDVAHDLARADCTRQHHDARAAGVLLVVLRRGEDRVRVDAAGNAPWTECKNRAFDPLAELAREDAAPYRDRVRADHPPRHRLAVRDPLVVHR